MGGLVGGNATDDCSVTAGRCIVDGLDAYRCENILCVNLFTYPKRVLNIGKLEALPVFQ